jgi:hypothetical protein
MEAVASRIQGTSITAYANTLVAMDLTYMGRDGAKQIGFSEHLSQSLRSRESEEFLDKLSDT